MQTEAPEAATPAVEALPPARPPRSAGRRALLALVYLAYVWALVELASWVGLWALHRYKGIDYVPAQMGELIEKHRIWIERRLGGRGDSYMVADSELGWVVGKSRKVRGYHSNSAGIRSNHEYAPVPPPGVLRIGAFGDSFTHASDVANPVTWEMQLEGMVPGLEVLNFGVPGYGPDQAFLRYRREGVAFHPHIVFIGFMSENVGRVVNTFRPFYFPNSGMAFGKPRFALDGSALLLYPNPLRDDDAYRKLLADPAHELPRVGEHDYYYQQRSRRSRFDFLPSVRMAWVIHERFAQPLTLGGVYNPRWEGFRVSVRMVEQFYREALQHGSLPVVVLFPQRSDLRDHRDHRPLVYGPLLAAFHRDGLVTIDLMDAFDRYDPQGALVLRKFIHYPPDGNTMVARYLVDWLRAQKLDTPAAAEERMQAERHRLHM
jgi:hypothetical protein